MSFPAIASSFSLFFTILPFNSFPTIFPSITHPAISPTTYPSLLSRTNVTVFPPRSTATVGDHSLRGASLLTLTLNAAAWNTPEAPGASCSDCRPPGSASCSGPRVLFRNSSSGVTVTTCVAAKTPGA